MTGQRHIFKTAAALTAILHDIGLYSPPWLS
jgi:hypothetical protein